MPQLVIPNTALESFLDTSDEWIRPRTGIEERHIHDGNLEALAADAARLAVENAGLAVADIDFLICSTVYNRFMTARPVLCDPGDDRCGVPLPRC